MLDRTFCHLPGVGAKTERRLWDFGYWHWLDLLRGLERGSPPVSRPGRIKAGLEESLERLQRGDAAYFAELLPQAEMWRLFPAFRKSTAYVDIETTGLGRGEDHITSIALWDGTRVATYVHGRNLEQFEEDISRYSLLVTFNGSRFDLPFLRRQLRPDMPRAHIDLRFLLKGLGVTGGLKSCEDRFGMGRKDLCGVDGYAAVLMWQAFQIRGEERVLRTLLAYNVQDVLSLEALLYRAYNMKLAQMGMDAGNRLDPPELAANPYQPSPEVLRELGYPT